MSKTFMPDLPPDQRLRLSLITVLEVINQRKTALISEIQRVQADKRVKDAHRIPSLFARIEETDIILNHLKMHFEKQPAVHAGPIPRNGNIHPGLHTTLFERPAPDALGQEAEGQGGPDMDDPVPTSPKPYHERTVEGLNSLHPIQP